MATERAIEESTSECGFEWGTCTAVHDPQQPTRHFFHLCVINVADVDKGHEGLHGCGDCGVVYLKRRDKNGD